MVLTNAVLHLLAIANEAGVKLELDDFNRIAAKVPHIADMKPGGKFHMSDLVFAPTTLAAGATTTVHVVATTDKADCGQVDNTASVTSSNAGSDSDGASVDVNCAAIDVEKVADDQDVSAGDQIGFTVTLRNTGEGEAKGISVHTGPCRPA